MNLHFGVSWVGAVIFALPMIVNIFYAIFPPKGENTNSAVLYPVLEMIENITRIAYLFALVLLVSNKPLSFSSPFLYISIAFLVLYHVVWIMYFATGRNVEFFNKNFLFVPVPLAIFPILYFIFAALWMHNIVAAIIMVVFGIAHITNSYKKTH